MGIALIVLGVVTLLAGLSGDGDVMGQVTRSFVLEPGQQLAIAGRNGAITYEEWDGHDVQIEATTRASALARVLWTVLGGGDAVHFAQGSSGVEAAADSRTSFIGWAGFQVGFHVRVPRGWTGSVQLVNANGNISAAGLSGDVLLRTTNGPIAVQGMTGTLEARTSNGTINLADVHGSVTAVTSNGVVLISGGTLAGSGRVQTTNGAIELRAGFEAAASYDLTTTNGAVRAYLPNPDVVLDLTAMNGEIRSQVPFVVSEEGRERVAGRERERLEGRIGAGSALLRIRTSNGPIDVITL